MIHVNVKFEPGHCICATDMFDIHWIQPKTDTTDSKNTHQHGQCKWHL